MNIQRKNLYEKYMVKRKKIILLFGIFISLSSVFPFYYRFDVIGDYDSCGNETAYFYLNNDQVGSSCGSCDPGSQDFYDSGYKNMKITNGSGVDNSICYDNWFYVNIYDDNWNLLWSDDWNSPGNNASYTFFFPINLGEVSNSFFELGVYSEYTVEYVNAIEGCNQISDYTMGSFNQHVLINEVDLGNDNCELTFGYLPLYPEDLQGLSIDFLMPGYTLSYSIDAIDNLNIDLQNHSFSDIPIGSFNEQDFTIENISGSIQEIDDIFIGNIDYTDTTWVILDEFEIVNETHFDLYPGEYQLITVRYSPQNEIPDNGYLYFSSPDYLSYVTAISGISILPTVTIDPDSLDFGSVQVGAFEEVEISVYPDFSVGAVDVVDVNTTSSVFTIISDTAFTILPEEIIPITVRFSPEDEDSTYTGNLEIIFSAGDTTLVLGSSILSGSGSGVGASPFSLVSPINGTEGVLVHTNFNWDNAFGGSTGNYLLRYGQVLEDILELNPGTYIEVNGISDNSYFVEVDLPVGSEIFWIVWAVNPDGTQIQSDNLGYFSVQGNTPELNGIISGPRTLLLENSPYLVTGNVEILENNHLIIPAGMEIRFDYKEEEQEYFEIVVGGELRALGTAEEPVFFHSDVSSTPGMWKGIRWTDTANNLILNTDSTISAGSYFSHTHISDAGNGGQVALDGYYDGRSITKSLLIENSDISSNDGPGIRFGHLSHLIGSIVSNNNGYGVNGGLYFSNNTISGNASYGINTQDGEVFTGNEIVDNAGDGIVSGKGNLFQDNTVGGNNGNGIQTDLGYTFDNNMVVDNTGYGVYAGLGETFTSNIIFGNGSYGVKTEAGELFENNVVGDNDGFGIETTTAYSSGTITFSNNNVSGNTGVNGDWDGGILTSILAEFTDNVVSFNTGYGITGGHSFSADSLLNNSSYGIHTDGGDSFNNTVVNNNGGYGIYTATGNTFSNNDISANTGYGLHSDAGDTFENNTVNDNGAYGIYSGSGDTFTLNTVSSNGDYGINTVTGNSFENNVVTNNTGYGINTDAGDSFTGNTVAGNGGFGIDTDAGNTFTGNTVSENVSWGINTDAGETFDSNSVENNNGYGINTDTGNTFANNIVSGNGGYGIKTDTGDSFTSNNVENNSSFGIDTDSGELFTGNVVTGNTGYGINTDSGAEFTDNTVSSNGEYGINTDSGHTFSGNTISDNSSYGLNISPGGSAITLSGNQFDINGTNGLQSVITTSITIDNNSFTGNMDNGIVVDSATAVTIIALTLSGDGVHDFGSSTPDGSNENGLKITNVGSLSISTSA